MKARRKASGIRSEDWDYEHSPEAIARSEKAREQYRRGQYKTLEQLKRELEDNQKQTEPH